jgi:predicted RNA-binding protein
MKPFHRSQQYKKIRRILRQEIREADVCFYAAPFGIIPIELDEVYPLSQHETAMPLDKETIEHVAQQTANHIKTTQPKTVILIYDPKNWNNTILKTVTKTCKQNNITLKTI